MYCTLVISTWNAKNAGSNYTRLYFTLYVSVGYMGVAAYCAVRILLSQNMQVGEATAPLTTLINKHSEV